MSPAVNGPLHGAQTPRGWFVRLIPNKHAICELLSYDHEDQRPKVLVADDRRLRITETAVTGRDALGNIVVDEPTGALFAEMTWDEVIGWTQFMDETSGQPYWILTLKAGASVPGDIDGLDVTSPTDESRWLELLKRQPRVRIHWC